MKPSRYIKYLGIIPARGGSKRLPWKNIRPILGIPLIEWTIQAALGSKLIEEVLVTTDSENIAAIAKMAGASVPFLRPIELSTDEADSISVVFHAINHYSLQGIEVENVVLLQPTSPLRNALNICKAIELFETNNANAVISVCPCEHSPLWSNTLNENLGMDLFLNMEVLNRPEKSLNNFYRLNGAIYIVKKEVLETEKRFINIPKSFAYIMNNEQSVDIDNEIDFQFAEFLMKRNEKKDCTNL